MNALLFDEVIADAHAQPLPAATPRVKLPWLPRKVDAIVAVGEEVRVAEGTIRVIPMWQWAIERAAAS